MLFLSLFSLNVFAAPSAEIDKSIFTTNKAGLIYEQFVDMNAGLTPAGGLSLDFPFYGAHMAAWWKFLQVEYSLTPPVDKVLSFENTRTRVLARWYNPRYPIYYSAAGFESRTVNRVSYNGFHYYSITPQRTKSDIFIVDQSYTILFRSPNQLIMETRAGYGKQIVLNKKWVLIPSGHMGIGLENFGLSTINFGLKLRVTYSNQLDIKSLMPKPDFAPAPSE